MPTVLVADDQDGVRSFVAKALETAGHRVAQAADGDEAARLLDERRFERLGGTRTLEADVRWIAATNRDLEERLASGAFRDDLYHRLAVFPVRMPPLRERREDVLPLARTLLERIGRDLGRPVPELSPEAEAVIEAADWSGNVRELANALERAAILTEDGTITPELLTGGHRRGAARELGIGERTLYDKLKRYWLR